MRLRTTASPGSMATLCGIPEITIGTRFPIPSSQSTSRIGNSTCMTSYLIVTRVAIILWTNLAVMPATLAFDAGAPRHRALRRSYPGRFLYRLEKSQNCRHLCPQSVLYGPYTRGLTPLSNSHVD